MPLNDPIMDQFADFDEYLRQGEPTKLETASAWSTAIGLQAVDGLVTSEYLKATARRNIDGEITIDEAHKLITTYYQSKQNRIDNNNDNEEADKVATNITKILTSNTLAFNTNGFISLHRRIFNGVFKHAGTLRPYDITKKEWVLRGDTVRYLNWEDLRMALDYDIEQERNFSYSNQSTDKIIQHIAKFVSGLWQIHPFREGNTRTTAVFAILYLRSIGYEVNNAMFAKHSWYFRNALVRANYKNANLGINYTPIYLERFFRNLLFKEDWILQNRYLIVNPPSNYAQQPRLSEVEDKEKFIDKVSEVEPEPVQPEQKPVQVEQGAPEQVRQSTSEQVNSPEQVKISTHIENLIMLLRHDELSIKEMMEALKLKHRPNFLEYHLNPAIKLGFIEMLYPNSPRHPRQKYTLTEKGFQRLNSISNH